MMAVKQQCRAVVFTPKELMVYRQADYQALAAGPGGSLLASYLSVVFQLRGSYTTPFLVLRGQEAPILLEPNQSP